MDPDPWWAFALAPDTRADPGANRQRGADGAPLVNPPGDDGRLGLDYAGYLGLADLLGAGTPATTVPDERAFVVVHQLCEVVFKQMTFDLAVVTATFERLLGLPDPDRAELALAEGEVDQETDAAAVWRPAITASNRLRHAARRILPPIMELMGRSGDDDVLFSRIEFAHFRSALEPSSGFQAAQLRLIQRALGKAPLLDLRVFPGDSYGRHYTGSPCGHVALADPLVLQGGAEMASPLPGHPAAQSARLDGAAHDLMATIPALGPDLPPPPAVRRIHDEDVARAVDRFRATLGAASGATAATDAFRTDLERAARTENARRDGLGAARQGAYTLQVRAPRSALAHVLSRIAALDDALHAPGDGTFLSVHRRTVRRHVTDGSGTGGGGMPYLVTSQRYLLAAVPRAGGVAGPGAVSGARVQAWRSALLPLPDQVDGLDGVAEVRDHDAPAHHQRDVHGVEHLVVGVPRLGALLQVVVDAVVAAQDRAGDQPQQLLGAAVERAVAVGGRVEVEEPLDAQVRAVVQDACVHAGAVGVEAVEAGAAGAFRV